MHYVDILSYNLLGWFIYPYVSIWMRIEQFITCHLNRDKRKYICMFQFWWEMTILLCIKLFPGDSYNETACETVSSHCHCQSSDPCLSLTPRSCRDFTNTTTFDDIFWQHMIYNIWTIVGVDVTPEHLLGGNCPPPCMYCIWQWTSLAIKSGIKFIPFMSTVDTETWSFDKPN